MIVDDQSFNVTALMLLLEYCVNIDVKKVCESADSGKTALEKV